MTPVSYLLEELVHALVDEEKLTSSEKQTLKVVGAASDLAFAQAFIQIFVFGANYQTAPHLITHVRAFMNPVLIVPAVALVATKAFVAGHSAIAAAKPQHQRASYWQFVSQAMTGTGPGVGGWTGY